MKLPAIGEIIGGKYRLDSILGVGGFATVYLATDVVIDRSLAVKVLTPNKAGAYPPSVPARFAVEARTLGALTNPHTIRMFDCGRTEAGVLFMVFELLGGSDLSDFMAKHGAMSEHDAAHVLLQLLESLSEAHSHGILHRDIKPANIRIYEYAGDPLRAKLMDFGIARWLGDENQSITATGKVIGTVRYMSPEQVFGEEMTPASDLFSLALVVHQMLTLDARPSIDFIGGHVEVALPGTRLGTVLRKMLKRDVSERYMSAEEVLRDLRGQSQPERVVEPPRPTILQQRPAPPTPSGPEEQDISKALLASLGVGVALFALVAVVLRSSKQPTQSPDVRLAMQSSPRGSVQGLLEPKVLAVEPDAGSDAVADVGLPFVEGCGLVAEVGTTFTTGGVVGLRHEQWDIHVPEGYDPAKRHALMVLFHADASTPREAMRTMSVRKMSNKHNFLIVAPRKSSTIAGYRYGVDVNSVRGLVDRMKAEYCVDPDRIFVFGTGGGGAAVEALACEPWVAAVTSMSWRRNSLEPACAPSRPVPNLHLAPTKSKHLPVQGGVTCAGYDRLVSLDDHEELWRRQNHCTGKSKVWRKINGTTCYEWDCDAPFVSCHLDGGHAFVGHKRTVDFVNCDGPPVDFPSTEVLWDFLQQVMPEPTEDTPRPDDQ